MKKQNNEEMLKHHTVITPDFVYIPIHAKEVAFASKSYVYDSTLLLIDVNKKNIYSPASGRLIGLTHVMTTEGKMNSMVIENDFLEKKKNMKGQKKQIYKIKKEEANEILNSFDLNFNFDNKQALIIVLSYDKKINQNDRVLLSDKAVELLEIIDALSSVYDIPRVIFSVNEDDEVSYEKLKDYIGTYDTFEFTCTKYNYDEKEKAAKKVFGKDNASYVAISLTDVEAIGNALKSGRLLKNRFITIASGPLKKPVVVYTKIGICTSELLAALRIKYNEQYVKLISSNTSVVVPKNEAIITKDVETILLAK